MRMSITSRTSSLAGGVLIKVLSSGNCGTGRDYTHPPLLLIPRFHPVIQEIIAYCCKLPGFIPFCNDGGLTRVASCGFLWGENQDQPLCSGLHQTQNGFKAVSQLLWPHKPREG